MRTRFNQPDKSKLIIAWLAMKRGKLRVHYAIKGKQVLRISGAPDHGVHTLVHHALYQNVSRKRECGIVELHARVSAHGKTLSWETKES